MPHSLSPSVLSLLNKPSFTTQLAEIRRGIEKESLRITKKGQLSQLPHPRALGSSLTHPFITTDYSEALLEFITGVHDSVEGCLSELEHIHHYTYQHLDNEILWGASMPCFIADDKDIPIAHYGNSHIGTMKHVYRIGLEHRYGRLMQTIAGIHYNFSLSDNFWRAYQQELNSTLSFQAFKNQQYFHLIRNFQRHAWLLVYLFGASPAVCPSFVRNRPHQLSKLPNGDLGMPYGTCLRMGNLGYQSQAQDELVTTYNDVQEYIDMLRCALFKEHPEYAAIGRKKGAEFLQLNTNLLQIENEFYSIIRPKTITHSGEAPLVALASRGVEYIEVRCLDINPFLPLGIDAEQIRFVDAFLIFCLLSPSPALDQQAVLAARSDFNAVVNRGLDPELTLSHGSLRNQASQLINQINQIATALDHSHNNTLHQQAVAQQHKKINDSVHTPAKKILQLLMQHQNDGTPQHFFHWALAQSQSTHNKFMQSKLNADIKQRFDAASQHSLAQFCAIDGNQDQDFELFLQQYYLQYQSLAFDERT